MRYCTGDTTTLYEVSYLGLALANQSAALRVCIQLCNNMQRACDWLHNIVVKTVICPYTLYMYIQCTTKKLFQCHQTLPHIWTWCWEQDYLYGPFYDLNSKQKYWEFGYSKKLSREKSFTNFAGLLLEHQRKFSPRNLGMPYPLWWILAFHKSFICEMVSYYWSMKVFSLESFPLYGIFAIAPCRLPHS